MKLDIRHVARILGGDVTGPDQCNVPGPGHSTMDRSLSIRLTHAGFVVHSFANDDWKECREYACSKLGFFVDRKSDWTPRPDTMGDDAERRKRFALKLWAASIDPRGTLAERYLREHRGLCLPDGAAYSVIRFHAGLRYEPGKNLPAMVALLRDIKSDEAVGIHRTFLHRYEATKIDRRMLGIAKGAAIKFDPVASSLVIGEGIETVLAAREAGFGPAWALGSAGAVGRFPLLRGLCQLTILLENDAASQRNVSLCLQRYRDAGRTVKVIQSSVGSDFNDAWRAMQDG